MRREEGGRTSAADSDVGGSDLRRAVREDFCRWMGGYRLLYFHLAFTAGRDIDFFKADIALPVEAESLHLVDCHVGLFDGVRR